jgi:hypothetical protein
LYKTLLIIFIFSINYLKHVVNKLAAIPPIAPHIKPDAKPITAPPTHPDAAESGWKF